MKITQLWRIEDGILKGTEISPFMAFILVKYPHRKSPDLYIPPIKAGEKEVKTWHCCQEACPAPDFEGGLDKLVEHLLLHKGRLVRPWSKKAQLQAPLPAVRLPPNPWRNNHNGVNDDRCFCLDSYIQDAERALRKQGIEIINAAEVKE